MPLFGAPQGIIAAEENNRNAIQSSLNAQKTMGDIAMQPAIGAQHAAQAVLTGAQAQAAIVSAQANEQMLELQKEFMVRSQASDAANAQGTTLTVNQLPPGGMLTKGSQADALERFADFAQGRLPPTALMKIRDDIASVHQKEAAAGFNQARQLHVQQQTDMARIQKIGQVAGAAAASPQNYMAILSDPTMRQLLPSQLTGNYATDLPVLQAITATGQTSIQRMEMERKLADDRSKQQLRQAEISQANSRIALSTARVTEVKTRTQKLEKELGGGSPDVTEAKRALVEARKVNTLDKQLKTAPYAPADPKKMQAGKIYTHKDGSMFQWQADPASPYGGKALKVNPAGLRSSMLAPSSANDGNDTEGDDDADE